MDDVLIIGGGPAGLFSAWLAHRHGLKVRVLATGIGTTHIMPGWVGVLATDGNLREAVPRWASEHAMHPYSLAGLGALEAGLNALQELCAPFGPLMVGGLERNMRLPTALGAAMPAAYAPASFVAGDLNAPGPMLLAGPVGWRDFYPALCAANLSRQGILAEAFAFDLPEIHTVKFDNISTGLARLFDQPEVRERVGRQIKARLNGASRVGLPAVLGLNDYPHSWQHLQDLIGVSVFEIPTLPPSVPGMRLYNVFKNALAGAGVQVLLNMPISHGLTEGKRVLGVSVQSVVRETVYRAKNILLATGGFYGGGILTDHHGGVRETVFGLPLNAVPPMSDWFADAFLPGDHPVHYSGVRVDAQMRPLDEHGAVIYENLRAAGRSLAGYNGVCEGTTEGVWISTAWAAVESLLH